MRSQDTPVNSEDPAKGPQPPKNSNTAEISMTFEKATKNTYRYLEDDTENPKLRTLYVQKSTFKNKAPGTIRVRLEWD